MTALQPKLFFALLFAAMLSSPVNLMAGEDGEAFFQQNCTSCHSIGGGPLVGPDLKGVTHRRSREWLEHFIQNPQATIDSGDSYAHELVEHSNGIVMPQVPGVTPAVAKALVDFLDSSAKPPETAAATAAPANNLPVPQTAVAAYFGQNCASCHTVGGGPLGGPDLKNVTQRKDRAWLVRFLRNPQAVIDSRDEYAAKLLEESQGYVMPASPGMNPTMANALLDLIEFQSAQSSQTSEQQVEPAFAAEDVVRGRRLFLGEERLAAGGPSCISCHMVSDIGGLGGGRLGPDLTQVYQRLNGRRGLSAWLAHPASATMQPIFSRKPLQPAEIHALTAYFEDSTRMPEQPASTARLRFLLIGLGGTVLGMVALNAMWGRRLRGVRRSLVHKNETRNGGRP